jgi:hypothetical protein
MDECRLNLIHAISADARCNADLSTAYLFQLQGFQPSATSLIRLLKEWITALCQEIKGNKHCGCSLLFCECLRVTREPRDKHARWEWAPIAPRDDLSIKDRVRTCRERGGGNLGEGHRHIVKIPAEECGALAVHMELRANSVVLVFNRDRECRAPSKLGALTQSLNHLRDP